MTATTATRPISAELLYDLELVHDPQISPDGRHIVFGVQRIDRTTEKKFVNLWLVASDGASLPRQLTRGNQRDTQPRWSPDGSHIAFVSNRDDDEQPQLYLLPLSGGDPWPITSLAGTFGSFEWARDGQKMVVQFRAHDEATLARKRDSQAKKLGIVARRITSLDYKLDGAGYHPETKWHLWRIDLADERRSATATQLTEGTFNEMQPSWSPDGSHIVFLSNRSADPAQMLDEQAVYTISAEGTDLRKVAARPGRKSSPAFSPDGQQISFLGFVYYFKIYATFFGVILAVFKISSL